LISPESTSLCACLSGKTTDAPAETYATTAMFEDQSTGNDANDNGTSEWGGSPAKDTTANRASDTNSSNTGGDNLSTQDLPLPQVGVADSNTPSRLVDLKSDLEKLLAVIASASPGRKAALYKEKLSLVRRISRADRLEKNMRINAMRGK
jgi:hypothetical protein